MLPIWWYNRDLFPRSNKYNVVFIPKWVFKKTQRKENQCAFLVRFKEADETNPSWIIPALPTSLWQFKDAVITPEKIYSMSYTHNPRDIQSYHVLLSPQKRGPKINTNHTLVLMYQSALKAIGDNTDKHVLWEQKEKVLSSNLLQINWEEFCVHRIKV